MSSSPIFDQLIVEFAQEHDTHFPRLIDAHEIMTKEFPEEKNDVTKNTLYDATHLKAIYPAIPEYEKYNKATDDEEEWTDEDRLIQNKTGLIRKPHLIPRDSAYYPGDKWMKQHSITPLGGWPEKNPDPDATQEIKLKDAPTTVMENLKEADEELGIAEFDEAFEQADRDLQKPTGFVRIDQTITAEEWPSLAQKAIEDGHVTPITKNKGKVTPVKRDRLPRRRNKRGDAKPTPKQPFNFFETDTTSSPGSAA